MKDSDHIERLKARAQSTNWAKYTPPVYSEDVRMFLKTLEGLTQEEMLQKIEEALQ